MVSAKYSWMVEPDPNAAHNIVLSINGGYPTPRPDPGGGTPTAGPDDSPAYDPGLLDQDFIPPSDIYDPGLLDQPFIPGVSGTPLGDLLDKPFGGNQGWIDDLLDRADQARPVLDALSELEDRLPPGVNPLMRGVLRKFNHVMFAYDLGKALYDEYGRPDWHHPAGYSLEWPFEFWCNKTGMDGYGPGVPPYICTQQAIGARHGSFAAALAANPANNVTGGRISQYDGGVVPSYGSPRVTWRKVATTPFNQNLPLPGTADNPKTRALPDAQPTTDRPVKPLPYPLLPQLNRTPDRTYGPKAKPFPPGKPMYPGPPPPGYSEGKRRPKCVPSISWAKWLERFIDTATESNDAMNVVLDCLGWVEGPHGSENSGYVNKVLFVFENLQWSHLQCIIEGAIANGLEDAAIGRFLGLGGDKAGAGLSGYGYFKRLKKPTGERCIK